MQDHGIKEVMELDIWGITKNLSDVIYNYLENHGDNRKRVEVKAAYDSDVRPEKKVLLENAKNQKGVLSSFEPFAFSDSLCEFVVGFVIYFPSDNFINPEIKSEEQFEVEDRFKFYKNMFSFPSTGNSSLRYI